VVANLLKGQRRMWAVTSRPTARTAIVQWRRRLVIRVGRWPTRELRILLRTVGYLPKRWRRRPFRLISAGVRPADSNQISKSLTRTLCSTSGCLTTTVIVVWPWPIPLAQSACRKSYYRKLWIRCGNEKGGVPFRVGHANPGGSRVEGDATDAEGSREWGWKGSRRAAF
jgi:hypothetical protein